MRKIGKTHIYYGEGKGKTSILNGITIRALGYHWNVKYFRFLKNRPTGELLFFNEINHPNLEIFDFYHSSKKFFWEMNDEEKKVLATEVRNGFNHLKKLSQTENIDIIIVDELLGCIVNQLITEEELILLIKNKNPQVELVFSGHHITDNLIASVDLVSNVQLIKHYFYDGLPARKGIEF